LSSYDYRRQCSDPAAELRRLQQQAALSFDEEFAVFTSRGLRDGSRVLEVGCGPGYFLAALGRALPGASLCGVDVDPELIQIAAATLGDRRCDLAVCDPGLESVKGQFDFVLCRYVLQHVADPQAFLTSAAGLLAPGGTLSVVETDAELWGAATPSQPQFARLYEQLERHQRQQGGDRRLGRRLVPMLSRLNRGEVTLDVACAHSGNGGAERFRHVMDTRRLRDAVARGFLSNDVLLRAEVEVERFLSNPECFMMALSFIGSVIRPLR
jgi:SAM-dependent methyltransferase